MHTFLKYFEAVVSVLLILSILMQNRTSGFSASSAPAGGVQSTKRGAEKVIFNATILFATLFVLSSLAFLFVK